MTVSDLSTATDVPALLEAGHAAARNGETIEARAYFRRVTELDAQNAAGWVGLGETSPRYDEKRDYFQRALALEPTNGIARDGLADAEQQLAAGHVLVPRRRRERPVEPATTPEPQTAVEYCYIHQSREAYVHCFQCDRPICSSCVNPTPVGQLCPNCRKQRRSANYKVSWRDLAIAFVVAFAVAALIGAVVALFVRGFLFFFLFFIGPAIAEVIVRAVERTTRMKRGRSMQITVSIAILLGSFAAALFVFNPLALLLFAVLSISTAVARLR
jgi:tetratricopeptide (TPR) repeat protein